MIRRTPIHGPARPGMTLLELLLALTIMASVMGLLGAIMAQARGWTDRSLEDEALMRLQRVGEATRTQWADRRTAVDLGDEGKKVIATSTELQFVTATGLLFPDWPLVMATYRIEPDTAHVSSSGLLWRLVYEETRIAGMDAPPSDYALDTQGRSMRDSTVLLDRCAELRWERFGRMEDPKSDEQADDAETPEPGSRAAARGASGRSGRSSGARADPEDEAQSTKASKDDEQYRWRPMEETFDGIVWSVRLVGSRDGERFGWVFVVRALR